MRMAVMMVVVVVMGDDDCDVCIAIVQRARGLFLALGYRWRIGTGTYMQSLYARPLNCRWPPTSESRTRHVLFVKNMFY